MRGRSAIDRCGHPPAQPRKNRDAQGEMKPRNATMSIKPQGLVLEVEIHFETVIREDP